MKIAYYIFLSGFNTFYKYMVVKKTIDDYSLNTEFMGMYKTTSGVKVPYANIFILSFVSLFLIDFLITILLFYISKRPFKEIFNDLSNCLKYIILIMCSCAVLYINILAGLVLILAGFILYILDVKRHFDKLCFGIVLFFNLLNLVILYYISL